MPNRGALEFPVRHMRRSLQRTWAALALAVLAVLAVAFLSARDFIRDVYPVCPGSLERGGVMPEGPLDTVSGARRVRLVFDTKQAQGNKYGTTVYENVRLARFDELAPGKECTCGSFSIPWREAAVSPANFDVLHDPVTGVYVLKGEILEPYVLRLTQVPVRVFQPQRVIAMRHVPSAAVLFAIGAIVVALFRSRRAMSYALRLHTWTEPRLLP